jgi:hypothetical protein
MVPNHEAEHRYGDREVQWTTALSIRHRSSVPVQGFDSRLMRCPERRNANGLFFLTTEAWKWVLEFDCSSERPSMKAFDFQLVLPA